MIEMKLSFSNLCYLKLPTNYFFQVSSLLVFDHLQRLHAIDQPVPLAPSEDCEEEDMSDYHAERNVWLDLMSHAVFVKVSLIAKLLILPSLYTQ